MKKAIVYLQSGGPTPVINSSLYGVIKAAKAHQKEISTVYGSLYGVEGLLQDNLIDLYQEDEETIELLKQTPGAILGTTRYKLPNDLTDPCYGLITKTVESHHIGIILINGGNDSMDTCAKLAALFAEKNLDVKVIGIPKTIDNDLAVTDHCIGFGSAAKMVVNTVKALCVDASCYQKGKVFIVEIMGRNAGWLTASVDLLPEGYRPDLIYLPEDAFHIDSFLTKVKEIHSKKGYVVAAISEGIIFDRDTSTARVDAFGHIQLGGAGDALATIVENRLKLPTRSVELSLNQRATPYMISKVDQSEAIACGEKAVEAAIAGETGLMVAIKRLSSNPYSSELFLYDVEQIANAEKRVPASMMNGVTGMKKSFRDYVLPLIQGEIEVIYEDGVWKHACLKKVKA